ncbi:MAG: hypothetical protein ACYDCL_03280 [Myxococcales bacterium]
MERLGPADVTFTFSSIKTPSMRPGSSWLSYWILGVLFCEGLGKFLWVDTGLPAVLPGFIAHLPRSVVVGGLLGLWQSLILFRWLKGGGDWWLPTLIGPLLGRLLAEPVHLPWIAAVSWLPGAAAIGLVTGVGQWLILRRTLRRCARWILLCPCAKIAAGLVASASLAASPLASASSETRLLAIRGVGLLGLALADGWLLGAVLRGMLEPGNYRGPRLRFPS